MWSHDGQLLSEEEARALAAQDIEADRYQIGVLEGIVERNSPQCRLVPVDRAPHRATSAHAATWRERTPRPRAEIVQECEAATVAPIE